MKQGVAALTKPRNPQGDIKRLEDAETAGSVYGYAIDLEGVNKLSNEDKVTLREFVFSALSTIEKARIGTCGFFNFSCKRQLKNSRLIQEKIK